MVLGAGKVGGGMVGSRRRSPAPASFPIGIESQTVSCRVPIPQIIPSMW